MSEIKRVAVVGAGTMGNGIVHVFAQAGYDVTMVDVRAEALEGALKTIGGNMDRQIKKGALAEADRDAALGRIRTSTDVSAVADADLVVEAATENRELKFRIFEERAAPAAPTG
jgi:3-hydroxybutyryl-CoA dehydrogenase